VHLAALIGDEVQPLLHQPGEQLPVIAAPVEDDLKRPAPTTWRTAAITLGRLLARLPRTSWLTTSSGRPCRSLTKYWTMPGSGMRRWLFQTSGTSRLPL